MSTLDPRRIAAIEGGLRPRSVAPGDEGATRSIAERMAQYGVPGLFVAVVEHGELAWAGYYGVRDAATREPVDEHTRFQVGSTSKGVAAVGVLALADAGLIALDDDVDTQLGAWRLPRDPVAVGHAVTPSALLAHDAGVTVHGFPGYAARARLPTLHQVLDGAPPSNTAPVRVDLVPGSRWRYSGGGYCVLQQLAIDRAGAAFDVVMRERVLAPLGMHDSGFDHPLPDRFATTVATAHGASGTPVAGRFHTYPELAAAGLWSTAPDLARFVAGVQAAWQGRVGTVVRTPVARRALTRRAGEYGLGLALAGEGDTMRFHHAGVNEGFEANMVGYVSRGQGVAVTANASGALGLISELVESVAGALAWPDFPSCKPIVEQPLPDAELREYVGRYGFSEPESVAPHSRDGFLHLENGATTVALVPRGGRDAFYAVRYGIDVDLHRDDTGRVTLLVLGGKTRLPRLE